MTESSHEPEQRGVFIALGSNMAYVDENGHELGQAELFRSVLRCLERVGVKTLAYSSLWSSPAWPDPALDEYANAVVQVDPGNRSAQELMQLLLKTETAFGRTREQRWGARTLDLDLIDYFGEVISGAREEDLTLPHIRAHERAFVMGPLQEIAPKWKHPVLGGEVAEYFKTALEAWPAHRVGPF